MLTGRLYLFFVFVDIYKNLKILLQRELKDLRGIQFEWRVIRVGFRRVKLKFMIVGLCVFHVTQLDEEKQPSYDSIKERIEALPVSDEMKTDLLEGVDTCRDFSVRIHLTRFLVTLFFMVKGQMSIFIATLKCHRASYTRNFNALI